jgi:hypothetical protein
MKLTRWTPIAASRGLAIALCLSAAVSTPVAADDNGDNDVPTCTAPKIFLELQNKTLVCQPRYVDNGDGTVTDNKTRLMWEKKSAAGTGDVHDVTNAYQWSASGSAADGTLFTVFLATLNSDVSNSGTSTCFANHCDWRIPNIVELQGILLAPYPCAASIVGSTPCIDPTFGPTEANNYWSSTSLASFPSSAFLLPFNYYAIVTTYGKNFVLLARAVRGGR